MLQSAGGRSFSYDGNGAQLQRGDDAVIYSAIHKPTQLSSVADTLSFEYGAFDHRVLRTSTADGTQTAYVGGMFERIDTNTDATEKFKVFAEGRQVAQLTRSIAGNQNDEEFVYLHHDALGSPDVATDEFGQVVNRFSFDPFGAKRGPQWDDDAPYSNLSEVNLGFTGHVGDVDAGLTYMNARMYDPVLGRFASADSIQPLMAWSQGLNRSSYVFNSPLRYTDPTGHYPGPPDQDIPGGESEMSGGFGFLAFLAYLLWQSGQTFDHYAGAHRGSTVHSAENGRPLSGIQTNKRRSYVPATRYSFSGPWTGSQANGVSFGAGKKELTDRQARRLAWWDNFGDLAASTAIIRPTATAWVLWAALASRPRAAHWVDRFVSEEQVETHETTRTGEIYVDAARYAEFAAAVTEMAMVLVPIAAESRLVRGLFRGAAQAADDVARVGGRGTKSAFETARDGGRHAGQLNQFMKQSPDQLRKSISTFEKNIAKHEAWIANPTSKVKNFHSLRPEHQENLLHHWAQDITRAKELKSIAEEVLKRL